jgi:hypothetical protein
MKLDMNLLTLIVGLSVYVSSIRFLVIGRLLADPPPDPARKASYKTFLKWLVPADILFVTSGLLLFLNLSWAILFGGSAPGWFPGAVIWLFFGGILWLIGHHAYSWIKTLRS